MAAPWAWLHMEGAHATSGKSTSLHTRFYSRYVYNSILQLQSSLPSCSGRSQSTYLTCYLPTWPRSRSSSSTIVYAPNETFEFSSRHWSDSFAYTHLSMRWLVCLVANLSTRRGISPHKLRANVLINSAFSWLRRLPMLSWILSFFFFRCALSCLCRFLDVKRYHSCFSLRQVACK